MLELSGVFCEADIPYSQEEYTAHLNDTKAFAAQNPNYSWEMSGSQAFRNLQILIHQGRWVMVSRARRRPSTSSSVTLSCAMPLRASSRP